MNQNTDHDAWVAAALEARVDQGFTRTVTDVRALTEVRNALEPREGSHKVSA